MFPVIGRIALLLLGRRVLDRVVEHPRVAPLVRTRKGRLALLVLGLGLRRHPRTRVVGHVLRGVHRSSRRLR